MKSNKGFTLIEMMIVVLVLGVLATIAIPSYRQYVVRGKCAQVVAPVHSVMVDLVGNFAENGSVLEQVIATNTVTINGRITTMPEDVMVAYGQYGTEYKITGSHTELTANECKNSDGTFGDQYVLKENNTEGKWE